MPKSEVKGRFPAWSKFVNPTRALATWRETLRRSIHFVVEHIVPLEMYTKVRRVSGCLETLPRPVKTVLVLVQLVKRTTGFSKGQLVWKYLYKLFALGHLWFLTGICWNSCSQITRSAKIIPWFTLSLHPAKESVLLTEEQFSSCTFIDCKNSAL